MSNKYLNSERSSSASKDEDYNYDVLDNVDIVNEDEAEHREVKLSTLSNQCEYCCSKYKNKKLLKIHQSLCSFKTDSSNTENDVTADEDKIYSDKIFPCSVCKQTFKSKKGLLRHEEKHKLPGGFRCNLCNERFITDNARWAHKEKTHKVFKCLICSIKFETSEQYNEHINELHNGKDREFVICTDCGTQFRTATQLKQHNDSKCGTEKTFFCSKCDSKFISHHTLTVHQKIHIGEKKYLCKFCGNNFLSKGQLKVHERSHTGEKPFKCEICNKAFAYRESLVTHSSLHTGIKPYICESCGTRFSCIGNLIKHRKARPDSCGLPQYNKNLKVAPRASSKNVRSLTMKKNSKETQSGTNEIDKIAEIIKEVKQTADAKLEYKQKQEQRTSVITFDNESSSTTLSENSKYSRNESNTTVIINTNMLNEMTDNDFKNYVVTAINSNDTKNEINTINTMASKSSYQIPVITTVEENIRKYEKKSIVEELILPTPTPNFIESINVINNNNNNNNKNNISSINDDIKPTTVIEANPINNYITTNENMEIITNVEIEYVISEELDRTTDAQEQEAHQQLQKQRQNIPNNEMNTSNYEISFIGDNINELTINQVNNSYVENWQNQTCEDVSFEVNCYNDFVEPIVVDENFVVKNEDEIEIQDINFPVSIKDQNEIITIMEIDYEDNVNNDNKNEINKHKYCVNSDEFNENLSIIDDEIASVIHESNYDNNIIKYTNNDNDDDYNNNDNMNHNNDTSNKNDDSHDNDNGNNDNNSNSNSPDHGNNNINNYDDDDDNDNNDDDNDDDYVNTCSDYDDNNDSDYSDNNSNNSNDKEPDGYVNENDNCDNDNDPNFLIKSKEELLYETNISVSYDCEYCPKKYTHKKPFVKHLLIQHNASLTNHLNINPAKLKRLQQTSKKQIYECKHCKKIYFSKFILEKHILNHGPEGTLINKCACCSKYFATMEEIKKHQLNEHIAKLQCVECKKLFKLPENLTAHVRYAHSNVERNIKKYSYVCPRCGRKFSSKIALSDHERGDCGHAPLYKCNLCGKCYHSSGSLKTHQSIHTGKLPHLCNFCGKAFRTQGQVKVHARKHTGEKPFGCEYCSKNFAYRESLLTHLSLHTGLKRFMCAGCGSRFSCISNLQAHRKSHKLTCGSIPNMTKAVGPMGSEKPIRVSVKRKTK